MCALAAEIGGWRGTPVPAAGFLPDVEVKEGYGATLGDAQAPLLRAAIRQIQESGHVR